MVDEHITHSESVKRANYYAGILLASFSKKFAEHVRDTSADTESVLHREVSALIVRFDRLDGSLELMKSQLAIETGIILRGMVNKNNSGWTRDKQIQLERMAAEIASKVMDRQPI
jgi:hypothetical protein